MGWGRARARESRKGGQAWQTGGPERAVGFVGAGCGERAGTRGAAAAGVCRELQMLSLSRLPCCHCAFFTKCSAVQDPAGGPLTPPLPRMADPPSALEDTGQPSRSAFTVPKLSL